MANSLNAVKRFTKAIIDGEPWKKDPLVVRKPWSYEEYALKEHGEGVGMCFAVMWDNEVVKPHPPLIRALEITKKALEKAGHKGRFVGGMLIMTAVASIPWFFRTFVFVAGNILIVMRGCRYSYRLDTA